MQVGVATAQSLIDVHTTGRQLAAMHIAVALVWQQLMPGQS
jgi:hypothetical protein